MFYCAYIYKDPRTEVERYVGSGTKFRFQDHLHKSNCEKLKEMLEELKRDRINPVITLITCDSREEAEEIEEDLIKTIGRIDLETGPLFNKAGARRGTGQVWTEERRVANGKASSLAQKGHKKSEHQVQAQKTTKADLAWVEKQNEKFRAKNSWLTDAEFEAWKRFSAAQKAVCKTQDENSSDLEALRVIKNEASKVWYRIKTAHERTLE